MYGIEHWPINIKNMEGEEFLVCGRDCSWRPRGQFPLELGFFGNPSPSTFVFFFPLREMQKLGDLVWSLDNPGRYREWSHHFDLFRIEEALKRGEILVYATADPDEAALKALREQIQLLLTQILTQERAEAARLLAVHSNRTLLEKSGAHVAAGARGFGEAVISFLTWVQNIHGVVSVNARLRRAATAAWEAHNSAWDGEWVETFKNKLIAAEHKEVVEALGFDPLKVNREMLADAYEIANLVWEDEKTQAMLVKFAEDYARAQHSLEWTNMAGGAAFEIILTVVLTVFTGGVGTAAMFGSKVRLQTPMKKLGELFEELAKLRRKFKLRKTKGKGSAGGKPSSLEDYVTDEPVPRPEPPPKGKPRQEGDSHGNPQSKSEKQTSAKSTKRVHQDPNTTWNPRDYADVEPDKLPDFDGKNTLGKIEIDGETYYVKNGKGQPGQMLRDDPLVKSGAVSPSHAEGHAVAIMKQTGTKEAVLDINHPTGPCGFCDKVIENMLPQGSKLTVNWPNGSQTFIGNAK